MLVSKTTCRGMIDSQTNFEFRKTTGNKKIAEISVDTGALQIDRWIVASDTISWNEGRVVARNMLTMSDTSKHCSEITRRLKVTQQRAMSAMQTMVLGHEGRLESMRGWIEEIGTTSKKKCFEHLSHLK